MIDDKRTDIQKKVDAFWVLKEEVHVVLKTGHWMNGLIIDVAEEFFIVEERKVGRTPVFFSDLSTISKYYKKEVDG